MKNNVFVFGRGFLGEYVLQEFKKNGHTVNSSRLKNCSNEDFKLDISDLNSIFEVIEKTKADLLINCAAITDLDFLEKNPDVGFEINSIGAKNIAIASKKYNAKLIHISTDGIFDGINGMYDENDIANPINTYGKTKLLAEKYVKQESNNYLILRTNFIGFDPSGGNLLNWMITKLSNNEEIVGFSDVYFTPLEISYLSHLIYKLSSIQKNLVLHLSSNQKISKYDLALMVAEIFNLDKNLIKKGSISELNLTAPRPKDTSLSNIQTQKILDEKFPSLRNTLKKIKSNFKL